MRSCFDCMLHVFILHVFDRDAVDFPLLPGANRFCGCFRLGSGPVVLWCFPAFCFAFSAGETQVWLGDLRVVALVCLLVLFCFNRFADFKDRASLYRCFCCLLTCKDRAISATSAKLEEKKCFTCSSAKKSLPIFDTHWLGLSILIVILARGHGSG